MLYKNIHYFFMDLFGEELLDYYIEEKKIAFNKEIKIVKFNPVNWEYYEKLKKKNLKWKNGNTLDIYKNF